MPTFTGNLTAGNASVIGNVLIGTNISAVGNVTGNTMNWSNNGNIAVYQIFNSSTGSLDTIFN